MEVGYGYYEKLLDVFLYFVLLSVEDIKLFVDEYLKVYYVVRVRCFWLLCDNNFFSVFFVKVVNCIFCDVFVVLVVIYFVVCLL